jgi:3-oxosteroid 1-dehydrogenase
VSEAQRERWDRSVDLLVVGAGAAGMTAALVGSIEGLETLVCEKGDTVGGLTSTAAGTAWIPGTTHAVRAGVPDDLQAARRYLDSILGTQVGAAERETFLVSGANAIDYLEAHSAIRFVAPAAHPDYYGKHPGAAFGGRALGTVPFDGRALGAQFERVRPPRREFMALGGMMVSKADLPALLQPWQSLRNLRHVAGMLLRYGIDRLRFSRGTRLVMGNALVGHLYFALIERKVPIRFETKLDKLVRRDGSVVGAIVESPAGPCRVRARKGVVLATGGIGWNRVLREQLFPKAAQARSLAPETTTGDGIRAALEIGAGLDDADRNSGLWMPCSVLDLPDGTQSVYPHIVLDRAKPGLLAVNRAGRRFVNEADSYHDFVLGMLRSDERVPSVPAHLICDHAFIARYGIGLLRPGARKLSPYIDAGYLVRRETLAALAAAIGVDGAALQRTVADYNRFAESGIDEEFGRGASDLNRFNGDPDHEPNPCLGPIGPGPFYAVAVWPADLANSAGLRTDGESRVLADDHAPIPGLYACGNDAASVFRGAYPGPGATIGAAIVFAWRAALHAAGRHARIDARPISD